MMKKTILFLYTFFVRDIWRKTETELKNSRWRLPYNSLKVLTISIRGFVNDRLSTKASALTYNTLMTLVPVLAMLIAIARGFGFQRKLKEELQSSFSGQQEVLNYVFDWVDSYLLQATGSGIFIGVGLLVLLWAILSIFGNIELSFNAIWQVKKGRTYLRQVTDYFSLMLVLPVFLLLSSGISVFMSSHLSDIFFLDILAPIATLLVKIIPYLLNWVLFSLLYMIIPNTKVKFSSAFLAGIVAGSAFQLFQFAYIRSQMGVNSYNAIYGTFAALPLFLLWLQISWFIVLFGAQMSFAIQNLRSFDYDADNRSISSRYRDFFGLNIISLIAKRFEEGKEPYTVSELSTRYNIPIRLVYNRIHKLQEAGLINEILLEKNQEQAYTPAIDINKLSVAFYFERMRNRGSEYFNVDKNEQFAKTWQTMLDLEQNLKDTKGQVLVKDLL
jgi:membrane protein